MKKIIVLISILAILLYGFYKPNIVIPDKVGDLRVVSYNLRYGSSDVEGFEDRKAVLVEQILSYNPDIIGIQEGDWYWMHSENSLPTMLEDYEYVGVGRDDGSTSGEYAAIFYKKDKYKVIDQGYFWLSETPDQPSLGWDAVCNRICTWVTLEDQMTKEVFTHFNTHFDHKGKEAQVESIKLLLKAIEDTETPVILTGDLNFLSTSKNYKNILGDHLKDTKKNAIDVYKHGTMNWFLNINVKLLPPIDYCLVTKDIKVLSYYVDPTVKYNNKPVSDHFPIIVDLTLN